MPFLAFFSGPLGRVAIYAVAFLAICGAAWAIVHEHDARIRAEDAARVAAVAHEEELRQARANVAAVQAEAAEAVARAQRVTTIKTEIAHAAPSTGCASSPAVRAALDGLRNPGAGGGAPGGAAVPVGMRPPAGAPVARP